MKKKLVYALATVLIAIFMGNWLLVAFICFLCAVELREHLK